MKPMSDGDTEREWYAPVRMGWIPIRWRLGKPLHHAVEGQQSLNRDLAQDRPTA